MRYTFVCMRLPHLFLWQVFVVSAITIHLLKRAMVEKDSENRGNAAAANDRALREAGAVMRTGQSAYDNGNYKLAEPLLLKALDAFELHGVLDSPEYYSCLSVLADNYFHLKRYFEAKGFYERLSVARLKNPDATDAQVVVALLKLASCQEKLHEINDALNSFELILELAETTIPHGHALFGVIFDSYELLVEKHVDRPQDRSERLNELKIKREQFGFAETKTGQWDALPNEMSDSQIVARYTEQPGSAVVLSKTSEELLSALSAWTEPELSEKAHDLRVKRATGEVSGWQVRNMRAADSTNSQSALGNLGDLDDGAFHEGEKHLQVHLTTDMFKRKPRMGDQSEAALPALEVPEAAPLIEEEPVRQGPVSNERLAKAAQRVKADRRPFNPLPALTAVIAVLGVIGSMYVAHEWTKTAAISHADVRASVSAAADLVGKEYTSSDGQKKLRITSLTDCEYIVGGATVPSVFHIHGEPEASTLSGFFNSGSEKLALTETASGFVFPDGVGLYTDTSKDRVILNKIQATSNFATFYYASHDHVYPTSTKDNVAGSTSFNWVNPLTDQVNAPVVEAKNYEVDKFDELFVSKLRDFRASKSIFAVDESTTVRPGQIECLSIVPGGEITGKPGPAPSGFLIRGYDSEGKLFKSSDGQKAFVISLKSGISVDPGKASKEEAAPPAVAGKYSFEITLLPKAEPASAAK
jgi:tetratricopeptide (TPR) repeat protein